MNTSILITLLLAVLMGMVIFWSMMIFQHHFLFSEYRVCLIACISAAMIFLLLNNRHVEIYKVYSLSNKLFTLLMVSLVIPLYQQLLIVNKNKILMIIGILAGVMGSIFGVILPFIIINIVPKITNIETPMQIIAKIIGTFAVMIAAEVFGIMTVKGFLRCVFGRLQKKQICEEKMKQEIEKLAIVVSAVLIGIVASFVIDMVDITT